MKNLFLLAGFACLIAMLLPTCAPAPEPEPEPAPEPVFDQAAEEAAIREVEEKAMAAADAHDIKTVMATRDACAENWEGTIKGRAAGEKAFELAFAGPWKNLRSKLVDEIGIVFMTPDVAIFKGIYEWSGMSDEAGNELPTAKYLYAQV